MLTNPEYLTSLEYPRFRHFKSKAHRTIKNHSYCNCETLPGGPDGPAGPDGPNPPSPPNPPEGPFGL